MLTRRQSLLNGKKVESATKVNGNIKEHPNDGNKRKIKSSASPRKGSEKRAKVATNNISGVNDDCDYSERTCLDAIEHIFAENYVNVVKRLKLTYPAKCAQYLRRCSQEHFTNDQIPMSKNMINSDTFLKNHQPLMFMHSVQMDVLQSKFPGRQAIQSLFELILCINVSAFDEYNVEKAIDIAAFTISNIMEKFPPCWMAANKEYRTLLNTTTKKLLTQSDEFLDNRTLFGDLMVCLENIIQVPAKSSIKLGLNNSETFNDSLTFNDSIKNFGEWESKNAQKYSFDTLPREQKISRVFLVLSLFVQLFEVDLAMWTIRNIRNPSGNIFNAQKRPLIGSILWANDEPNQVNYCIKNILKLYVNYVSIDFPSEETDILGRLVNIIYNVFDLSEFRCSIKHIGDRIDYPQSIERQSHFCEAFVKTIFDYDSCNIELWLKIINRVKHSSLKLYLINALFTKIEHQNIVLNPKSIFNTLRPIEVDFDYYFGEEKHQNNNNNIVKPNKSKRMGNGSSSSCIDTANVANKYPYLQKISRRAASELLPEHHVQLQLTALNAYMNIFHTHEIQQNWKNYQQNQSKHNDELKQYKSDVKSFEEAIVDPFDLDEMRQALQEPLHHTKLASPIYSLDVMNEACKMHILIHLISIKNYRSDAKYVDLISTELVNLRAKFSELFPNQI